MKQEEEKNIMLYIPLGINTRLDFFTGYGKKEMLQSLVGVIIGGLIALLVFIITNSVFIVMITLMMSVGGSILATTKNSINQSIVDYIGDVIAFSKSRKTFPYRQLKEWE